MLQLRKKILVGVLCSALVLSTSQSVAWSETVEVPTEAGAADNVVTAEAADAAEDAGAEEDTEAPVTEEQALAECVLYAETDTLEMHVNESNGIFAIKDKATGEYWWSNPYAADSDPIAKGSNLAGLKSALVIDSVKVTDTEAPETPLKSYSDAVQKGNFTLEKIENGFKAVCTFTGEGLTVPYYVTINDDYFEVNVPLDEIIEEEMNGNTSESVRSVVTLSLFKDMGAGNGDENGYIITPDGSGAVINFNNGKTKSSEYTQKIYGKDIAISQDMAPAKTEQAYLPVMGIVKDNSALLAVVTEGSAYASARASINGQGATGYNSAWFDFDLRSSDSYFMGQSNTALDAFEVNKVPESDITVRYYPIAKEGADYVDVALRYQKHLVDTGVLTKKTTDSDVPFYLDLFGGTVKKQSVAGFPVSLQTPATTYEEAKLIIEELANRGVDNMIITYEDFNKAGIKGQISDSVDYASVLGGKEDFKLLADYCASIGVTLAPSVDIQEYE